MRHEEGGLIYLTGSIDLWAKQFPTFLGQVLHLLSSALSGGLKGKNVGEGKVQGRNSPAIGRPARTLFATPSNQDLRGYRSQGGCAASGKGVPSLFVTVAATRKRSVQPATSTLEFFG